MIALRLFSRFLLGILFIFSGFVKAIDPLGSAYKFSDYFHAFGLSFMDSLALPLAIFLAAFELVLGIVLILGYQKKRTYWLLLFFMTFFTVLTFILALTNPVTDCGCFGDAVILTNWETFFKNMVFMVFALILFQSRRKAVNVHRREVELFWIALFFAGSFILSLNAIRHLPLLDFRPYNIGTHIPSEMEVPEDAPRDVYETVLYYKNTETGETEEFSIDDYPSDTIAYQFVTSESNLVKKGYEPPIHDFGIMDPEGVDVTDNILSFHGYTLLMISHDLENVSKPILSDGNNWSQLEQFALDFRFIPVTAAMETTIEEVSIDADLDYDFYVGDEIMLKTMVRSNPGFIMLKNGTIISKWGNRDFPPCYNWNSKWVDLIQNYAENLDPEVMMLIEEGLLDDFQYKIIDFDATANRVISDYFRVKNNRQTWALFMLTIALVLVIPQFLPSIKPRRRA
jgi:uncharacterized membrane protein YphA (DoxX/SURF4 family)